MQKFVYIVSSPHGGSTLFSHVLGKHPQALNLGEVSFLPKLLALGELCSCGSKIRECEFWGGIFSEYASIVGYDLRHDPYEVILGDAPKDKRGAGLIDTQQQTRLRFLAMKIRGALDTVAVLHTPKSVGLKNVALPSVSRGAENTLALYETALYVSGKNIVVDASKMPRKAAHLYVARPEQVRIIHLTRDGRGVVASRKKYMDVSHAAERWAHYHKLSLKLLERWVPQEHRFRWSYEEFVTQPEESLKSISEWLGVDYAEQYLVFDNTAKSHAAGGNPARFELDGGIRGVDERWRESLTEDELTTFERLAGEQNRAFGYE
jgi:hypothetical protein